MKTKGELKAVKYFEEKTGIKYGDTPEGIQTVSSTLTIELMAVYAEHMMMEFGKMLDGNFSNASDEFREKVVASWYR